MALFIVPLLFFVVMALLLLSLYALAATRVPVVSARQEVIDTALELLALKPGERFCDLGCGWGNVLQRARQKADVHTLGFELNPAVAFVAWLRGVGDGKQRVRLADSRRADLGRPDAVYAFLMPHAMEAFAGVLGRRLSEGARVASVDFRIADWVPAEIRPVGHQGQQVFLYVIGRHLPAEAPPDESPLPESLPSLLPRAGEG